MFSPGDLSQRSRATDAEASELPSENKLYLSHVGVLIKNALLLVLGCDVDLELWCYWNIASAELSAAAAASGCTVICTHVGSSPLFGDYLGKQTCSLRQQMQTLAKANLAGRLWTEKVGTFIVGKDHVTPCCWTHWRFNECDEVIMSPRNTFPPTTSGSLSGEDAFSSLETSVLMKKGRNLV